MKQKLAGLGLLALGLGLLVAAACSPSLPTPTPTPTATPGAAAPTATKPPAEGGASVSIQGFAFSPATLTVSKGTTVTWTNKDSVAHTVTTTEPGEGFDSRNMGNGATFSYTFNNPGTFKYRCSIHPSMTGTVVVSP